jgi:hypothetical protein
MVAFWLRSGCFIVAFWRFAFCCGCFASKNALRCGKFGDIFYGICCGICSGIFGLQLPAVWLRAGSIRVALGMLSVSLLFDVAHVLLRMLVAVAYFVVYVAVGLRSGCFLVLCSLLWLLRSYECCLLWYIFWNM